MRGLQSKPPNTHTPGCPGGLQGLDGDLAQMTPKVTSMSSLVPQVLISKDQDSKVP